MNRIKKIFVLLLLIVLFPVTAKADNVVNMYLFYGDGCPHCAEEEKFLDKYLKEEKRLIGEKSFDEIKNFISEV